MKWQFLKHIPKKKLILALGDVFLIVVTLAIVTAFERHSGSSVGLILPLPTSLLVCGVYLFSFYIGNLYVPLSPSHERNKVHARLILSVSGAVGLMTVFSHSIPSLSWSLQQQILFALMMIPFASGWRWVFDRAFSRFMRPIQVLLVGAGWGGSTIASALASKCEFHLIGFVDDDPAKRGKQIGLAEVLGTTSDLQALVERHHVSLLVLAITHEKRDTLFRSLLACKMNGIELCDMPTLYEELTGKLPVHHVLDSWFVYGSLRGIQRTIYAASLKRVLDLGLSFAGLILSIPIAAVTAAAIVAESGFPVLYKQKRVGKNEGEFWLLKFRSMRQGAEGGTGARTGVVSQPKDYRGNARALRRTVESALRVATIK